jgi:ketosteroid isomerase-like protein
VIIMADSTTAGDPMAVVRRLQDATNRHDLDALVACFAPDYLSEIPAADVAARMFARTPGVAPVSNPA